MPLFFLGSSGLESTGDSELAAACRFFSALALWRLRIIINTTVIRPHTTIRPPNTPTPMNTAVCQVAPVSDGGLGGQISVPEASIVPRT